MHKRASLLQHSSHLIESGIVRSPQAKRNQDVSARMVGNTGDAAGLGRAERCGRAQGMAKEGVVNSVFFVLREKLRQLEE